MKTKIPVVTDSFQYSGHVVEIRQKNGVFYVLSDVELCYQEIDQLPSVFRLFRKKSLFCYYSGTEQTAKRIFRSCVLNYLYYHVNELH